MTLTQIKYVVELARSHSFSAAASNLFVSQSVISTAVINLEKEIGEQIFIRNKSGLTLTPFGKTFVPYITSIQDQLDHIERVVINKSDNQEMYLSIANISYSFISDICTELLSRWNGVGLRLNQFDEDESGVINLVSSKIADIGVIRIWSCYKTSVLSQLKAYNIQFTSLGTYDVGVTVSKSNPLFYSDENAVSSSVLADYTSLAYRSMNVGPYSDIITQLDFPYTKNIFVSSSRAVLMEVLANSPAFMLDTKLPDTDESPNFRTFPIKDCNITSEIGWIKRDDYSLTPVASDFIRLLSNRFLR